MGLKGKGQSERRRRRKRRRPAAGSKPIDRPVDWIRSELEGAEAWLARLHDEKHNTFPARWRAGQITHYESRVIELRAELERAERGEE